MTETEQKFEVGIEFGSVLDAISKQIYDTPFAFVRENLQNAVDATRMQARRQNSPSSEPTLRIDIHVDNESVRIHDRGIGMSSEELRNLFWKIGASGKRNEEARAAGCVGKFGIGGFANLGVCETLIVESQTENQAGQRTRLSRSDIENANGLPQVAQIVSDAASPRGTIVEGVLRTPASPDELRKYVQSIVHFCREPIFFNGELISGSEPKTGSKVDHANQLTPWKFDGITVIGRLYETPGQTLEATLDGIIVGGKSSKLTGSLRFEGSGLDILKQGFKLCSTAMSTAIGVSGFIDCDLLSPTAGRDSLDAESHGLLAKIVGAAERAAVLEVLKSSELIDQHTRIFRYIRKHGLVDQIGNVTLESAGGDWLTLDDVKAFAGKGKRVYFGPKQNKTLTDVLQTRGHLVVTLPSDNHKASSIRDYLSAIGASHLSGQVELKEEYAGLSRFEKGFLGELTETISDVYQVNDVRLTPGRFTEDIPVHIPNPKSIAGPQMQIWVDTRHEEVAKLKQLGMSSLFRSMVSAFCREYLGPTLRSRSPKFFGSGALNLDWLAERRSETWLLMTEDIAVVNRSQSTASRGSRGCANRGCFGEFRQFAPRSTERQ